MELYFAPMTCSLASRIALYEAGVDATYHRVTLFDGDAGYLTVHPLGQVPALRTDDGRVITENNAVLLAIAGLADGAPEPDPIELVRWLSYLNAELHKGVFYPLFDPSAPDEARRWVLEHKAASRLGRMNAHMKEREHVVDVPSVADAYLFTILTWIDATPIELADYPALARFRAVCMERPSYARAYREELPLFLAERERRQVSP